MKKKLINLVVVWYKPNSDWDKISAHISETVLKDSHFIRLMETDVILTKDMLIDLCDKHIESEWMSKFIGCIKNRTMKLGIYEFQRLDLLSQISGNSHIHSTEIFSEINWSDFENPPHSSMDEQETLEQITFFFPEFEVEE